MAAAALLAVALAACSFAPAGCDSCAVPDDTPSPDASSPDGSGDATSAPDAEVDADAGLPIDSTCDPRREDCAAGLTCRIYLPAGDGRCRPVGTGVAGQLCNSFDQCPANAGCSYGADNRLRCILACDTMEPLRRCTATQICSPVTVGSGVGLCWPP